MILVFANLSVLQVGGKAYLSTCVGYRSWRSGEVDHWREREEAAADRGQWK